MKVAFKQHRSAFLITLLFLVMYCLISLVNHYHFRTYALDLGLYTNALWDYLHFQFNDSTVFKVEPENLLSDHFDLYLMLFAPFSLLFGTYTLLVMQILSILAGGWGLYFYFRNRNANAFFPVAAMLFFLGFFAVSSALSFEYHSNVVAAAMVPWFFLCVERKQLFRSAFLLLFILISRENVSFWMAFVCLGMMFLYWQEKKSRIFLALSSIFCLVYFVSVLNVIMPALSNHDAYPHFHYNVQGSSTGEVLLNILRHPVDSIKLLFVNHSGNVDYDFIKVELWTFLILSGFLFLLMKPQFIVMLIPIFFQKLFHDTANIWSVAYHYCIEFAPIMAIGVFRVLADVKNLKIQRVLIILVLAGTFFTTYRLMDKTVVYTEKTRIRFYSKEHYQRNFDLAAFHKGLQSIPGNARVSAPSAFIPHLALRDHVYTFPIVKDADYVVYSRHEGSYPYSVERLASFVSELENSGEWEDHYRSKDLLILKRKKD